MNSPLPYPAHIDGHVVPLGESAPGKHHYYYRLLCPCGSDTFRLWLGTKKTLIAECVMCGKKVTVYDLSLYPAATKGIGAEAFHLISAESQSKGGRVRILYEYGELDEDQEFDRNDLSWCSVWFEDDAKVERLVLNDESS